MHAKGNLCVHCLIDKKNNIGLKDYDLAMDFPQPEMDFNFNLDEEDIGDEELSMSMVRSLTAEQSSDENSQTENNTIGEWNKKESM